MLVLVQAPYHNRSLQRAFHIVAALLLICMLVEPAYLEAGTGRKKKKRGRRVRVEKVTSLTPVTERTVTDGVRYAEYKTNGRAPIIVHVVTMDRTKSGVATRIVKGEDRVDGREQIQSMSYRYGSESGNAVLALVNANFWAAVRNTPIGPCVVDGEVVEMNPYKNWSSAFFTSQNQIIIDTFKISGMLRWKWRAIPITSVNRRIDSNGVVVYNEFGGATVPFVNAKKIEGAFNKAIADSVYLDMDSTEVALSQDLLREEIRKAEQESSIEHPTIKIRVRYLRSPSLNRPLPCQVLDVDSGTVNMPLRGAVISVPRSVIGQMTPDVGDTITIEFSTNLHRNERFMNAVAGTPRLVRNGVAKHEAQREGSTGRRFISQGLARTSVGASKSGDRVILAVVPTSNGTGNRGATLADMSKIMQLLGAYQAMNLDGGGSSGMIVDNDNVFFDGVDPSTRPVSVGLAIVKLSHVLRSSIQYSK